MSEITVDQVVHAITARVNKNDRSHNSTWEFATRTEIAGELDVAPGDISREGGDPDGPLGQAVAEGRVEEHPKYRGYWRVIG